MGSKGTGKAEEMEQFTVIRSLLDEIRSEESCFTIKDLAVNGRDLQTIGLAPGPEIGRLLQWLLEQVQDEVLPNKKEALLQAVKGKIL